jgi:N-methylhydantoinase A
LRLDTAIRFPVRLVESDLAGGAILAAHIAAERSENAIFFDMGGTTAKICLIEKYQPETSRVFEVDRAARFLKGSGLPVRIPVIEMVEIGAGGGSIAWVDALHRIQVGPRSAGSSRARPVTAVAVPSRLSPMPMALGRPTHTSPAARSLDGEVG